MRYNLHKHANQTLTAGLNLSEAVRLPKNEELNDWIAVHVVDFFNRINLIYGVISEQCTDETCKTMSGGAKYEYLWCDGEQYKKPTQLSASKYITLLMEWVEKHINDESIFPVTVGLY
jgi:hypothetical protein